MKYILVFITLLGSFPLLATVPDSIRLDEVEVTAARYPQSLRYLAAPLQIVSSEQLQRNLTGDLSAVLASVPGVQLQSATFQTLKLSLRGIGSRSQYGTNRTRVYLNDIPMTGGDGTSVFDDLELSFIQQAEITKGSYSAWYGGGMGGAVRFVTLKNAGDDASSIDSKRAFPAAAFAQAAVTAGSFGLMKFTGMASVAYSSGNFVAGFSRLNGEGYRENSAFMRTSGLLTGEQSVPKLGKLTYLLLLSDVKAYTPSSVDETTYLTSPQSAAPNWLAVKGFKEYQRLLGGLKLETPIQQQWMNSLLLTVNQYDQYELRPFNILDDESLTLSFQESLRYSGSGFKAAVGVEGLMEFYSWQTKANTTQSILTDSRELRRHLNAFLSIENTALERLRISFGTNINFTGYRIEHQLPAVSTDLFKVKPIVSPMIGLSYPLSERLMLYGSAGHGFSTPTVEESLGSDGRMNPLLRPEQGWTVDAGFKSWLFNSKLAMQGSVYFIFLNDLLVTKRPSEDVFYGENAGRSLLQGIEGQLRYRPLEWISVNLSGSLSVNRFSDFVDNGIDYSGNHLPGIPSSQLFAEVNTILPLNLQFNATYRMTGSQFADDANLVEVGSWQTLDLGLNYKPTLTNKLSLNAKLSASNVFNEQYASMILINAPSFAGRAPRYFYPALPRHFTLQIQLQW